MKLGRVRSPLDLRDKRLATYASMITMPGLAEDLTAFDGSKITFPDFGNLKHGDCTCAALGHGEVSASIHNRKPHTTTLDFVLDAYDAISDWDRKRPNENDDGANNRDALAYFKSKGIIEAYVRLHSSTQLHIKFAIKHGGCYVGADLPIAAQKQLDAGEPWDVPKSLKDWNSSYRARSGGGHAMMALAYDRTYVTFVTWGRLQKATWEWFFTYVDETWFPIYDVWTQKGQLTASGFDVERLYREVGKIAVVSPTNPFS